MMELRQREPRVSDPAFLAFLRRQRCCSCDAPPAVQAAHLRQGAPAYGKRETGMGEKPDDRWALPLCVVCHLDGAQALHHVGEARFLARLPFEPFARAASLYQQFCAVRGPRRPPSVSPVKSKPPKVKSRPIAQRKNPWPKGRKLGGRPCASS